MTAVDLDGGVIISRAGVGFDPLTPGESGAVSPVPAGQSPGADTGPTTEATA